MTTRSAGWRSAALLLALLGLMVAPVPAVAQFDDGPEANGDALGDPEVRLHLAEISGILAPGEPLELRLRAQRLAGAAPDDLRLVMGLHSRTQSRPDLRAALDNGQVGDRALLGAVATPVTTPTRGRSTTFDLEVTPGEIGLPATLDGVGVYPLRLQLLDGSEVLDEILTAVIVSGSDIERPLAVTLLVGLDTPGTVDVRGTPDAELVDALALGGALASTSTGLAGSSGPMTVATSPRVLEDLAILAGELPPIEPELTEAPTPAVAAAAARVLADLRTVLADEDVTHVAMPYGPGDLVALARAGLDAEALRVVSEGAATAARITGTDVDRSVLIPPDGLDGPTRELLSATAATVMVLDEDHLVMPVNRSLAVSPEPLRHLRGSTAPDLVAIPDPFLGATFEDGLADLGTTAASQRLLAEIATVFFERPFAELDRSLLVAPPMDGRVRGGVLAQLRTQLVAAPWAQPVSMDGLAEPRSESLGDSIGLAPVDTEALLSASYLSELAASRGRLGALVGLLDAADDAPARYERALLRASSIHLRENLDAGRALLQPIDLTGAQAVQAVEIVESPPVTLTAVEGQVPVTLRNGTERTLRVELRMDTSRHEFPDGAILRDVILEPSSTTTLLIETRALSPGGTAPIAVSLWDPQGRIELAEGLVVVRSTAYPIAGLALTGGAALILLVWGIGGVLRRRAAARDETADDVEVIAS